MECEWRPVLGYEGLYEVSDSGNVRSIERQVEDSNGIVRLRQGRILRGYFDGARVRVRLSRLGVVTERKVHRLVLDAFVGPRPTGMECCHNDGDPTNNHVSNLRWDTKSANCLDSVQHGTHHVSRRTHCPHGHSYEAHAVVRNGSRKCRLCEQHRSRTSTHERRNKNASLTCGAIETKRRKPCERLVAAGNSCRHHGRTWDQINSEKDAQ